LFGKTCALAKAFGRRANRGDESTGRRGGKGRKGRKGLGFAHKPLEQVSIALETHGAELRNAAVTTGQITGAFGYMEYGDVKRARALLLARRRSDGEHEPLAVRRDDAAHLSGPEQPCGNRNSSDGVPDWSVEPLVRSTAITAVPWR